MLWRPTSLELLEEAEHRILSCLKTPYKGRFVNVGPVVGLDDCKIWTISINESSNTTNQKTPLVLLHGLAAGVGFWSLNIESWGFGDRPVYAIDHLGFGQSSRPKFSTDPAEAERQFVTSIEEWRKRMELDNFVLLGHSLGGFIAMSYALSFPNRVSHLILSDPWGLTGKPKNGDKDRPVPTWAKIAAILTKPFNFLAVIRAAGPFGQRMIENMLAHTIDKFSVLGEEQDGSDGVRFGEYAYHCNAQDPTGETVFRTLSDFVWVKLPLIDRIPVQLHPDVDVTMIYGSKSFIRRISIDVFQQLRNNNTSYTNVQVLEEASHDVFLDKPDEFNDIVHKACLMADTKRQN